MNSYTDFELLIERTETGYRARVLKSPAGTGAGTIFDLPLETALADVSSREWRHLQTTQSPGEISSKELGRQLFQSVFAGPVLALWQRSLGGAGRSLRLRIRLEDEPYLLNIPWELLEDPDHGVIAIEQPVVRCLEGPTVPRPLPLREPLKILAILSCPLDLPTLDIDEEWRMLDRMLGPLMAGEKVVLERLIRPTPERIRLALQAEEWHILHFVGHGLVEEVGGALVMEDPSGGARTVGSETLGVLFNNDSLRLVVLNACEGACPGTNDPFSGVAQTLVKKGFPAVLAMQQKISDEVAIIFAEQLYRALSRRLPIDVALMEARKELRGRNKAEWAVPVLYLSAPDGNLIEAPVVRKFWHGEWFWIWVALAVLGTLLVAFAAGRLTAPSEPPVIPPDPPTRDSTMNPRECTSPEGLDIAFVRIDPGTFKMGQDKGDKSDEPVHDVSITQAFCLGAFEVTRAQWNHVLGLPPPQENEADLPQSGVTFVELQDFFRRLNEREKVDGWYRPPTEAEWELAARAGTRTLYSFGDDEKALSFFGNCRGDDGYGQLAPVGKFKPNPWGLYDMYGNVFEWVSDWYETYPKGPRVNPRGPTTGTRRVRRGGGWDSSAKACTSSARSNVEAEGLLMDTGFRIVREIR